MLLEEKYYFVNILYSLNFLKLKRVNVKICDLNSRQRIFEFQGLAPYLQISSTRYFLVISCNKLDGIL
jgi:hypothetical protein